LTFATICSCQAPVTARQHVRDLPAPEGSPEFFV